jgi:hypothetical protein
MSKNVQEVLLAEAQQTHGARECICMCSCVASPALFR